jgi:hypothetical protein
MFSLISIKKEFYIVNRDVLISEKKDFILNEYNDDKINYFYFINNLGINNKYYKYKLIGKNTIQSINDENSLFSKFLHENKGSAKESNLEYKLGYSEEIFKPYYRYMIPLLILKSYNRFMKYMGYNKSLLKVNKYLRLENNTINSNIYVILNFIIVKILLELFHFSYRSLIRVKPKLYSLSKIRYYLNRFKRLIFVN